MLRGCNWAIRAKSRRAIWSPSSSSGSPAEATWGVPDRTGRRRLLEEMVRRLQLAAEPFGDPRGAVVRLVAEVPGELVLDLLAEQLDVRPPVEELGVGERDQRERPAAAAPGLGRWASVAWLQIAWVRLLTVSLITTFRRAFRSVCLVMTDLAETVMIAPLPVRLFGPGESVTGIRTR